MGQQLAHVPSPIITRPPTLFEKQGSTFQLDGKRISVEVAPTCWWWREAPQEPSRKPNPICRFLPLAGADGEASCLRPCRVKRRQQGQRTGREMTCSVREEELSMTGQIVVSRLFIVSFGGRCHPGRLSLLGGAEEERVSDAPDTIPPSIRNLAPTFISDGDCISSSRRRSALVLAR